MHCWIIFNEYHTAEKATIYKCTNFQHHLSLLLSAASTHTIKQYPASNPQLTSQWWHDCGKLFGAEDCSWQCQETIYRQYIGTGKNISFINISPIYRDWLHSLGTRSAGKSLKVASTSCLPFCGHNSLHCIWLDAYQWAQFMLHFCALSVE